MAGKATKQTRPYALRKPCPKCPFRTDIEPYLRPERAHELAKAIQGGWELPCHETTVDSKEDDGERVRTPDSKACAGSLIIQEKQGQPNQMTRISERLGLYDPTRLDMDAPVYDSFAEWVRSFHPEVDPDVEMEHCGVVADDCEDPAGWGGYGGVQENDDPPTCNPDTDTCAQCGSVACSACRAWVKDGEVRCVNCVEDDEEVRH